MRHDSFALHPGQIPTNLKTIKVELFHNGLAAIRSLLKCLSNEPSSYEQMNNMIVVATLFERISCLVYRGKDGTYRKPPVNVYTREIVEGWVETPEEVFDHVRLYGVTAEKAEHIYKLVWQIADLVCPMMACPDEQAFVSEYAYAIEYVIQHDGDLPKPEITELFPVNYFDYHYQNGIAETIRKYIF